MLPRRKTLTRILIKVLSKTRLRHVLFIVITCGLLLIKLPHTLYNVELVSEDEKACIKAISFLNSSETLTSFPEWALEILLKSDCDIRKRGKIINKFFLRLRKILHYSLYEINLRITDYECAKWWANPLSITGLDILKLTHLTTQYKLRFEAQPGRIPFEIITNIIHRQESNNNPEEVEFLRGRRMDSYSRTCSSKSIPENIRKICLCSNEINEATIRTKEIREKWNEDENDPELFSWPPNVSMMAPDYIKYGSMKNFYVSVPTGKKEYCGPHVKLMIFVTSAPFNIEQRQKIRETFGNQQFLKSQRAQLVFVFDRVYDMDLQVEIDAEFREHDDIIQGNHDHSYHNLTLRQLSMFNWLVAHCDSLEAPLPYWILKADDDYFINIPIAVRLAQANPNALLMGRIMCGSPAERDVTRKYYTPKYIHAPTYFPMYLSGAAYFIQSKILSPLLKASIKMPMVHIDDAYITGILPLEIGVTPKSLSLITKARVDPVHPANCTLQNMLNSNADDPQDMELHWKYFQKRESEIKQCNFDKSLLKAKEWECIFE